MMLNDLEKEIWNKDSHEGKKLGQHIEECKRLVFEFLSFYGLDEYKEFAELLCYYHDLGKLKDEWNVKNKKNPPHAIFSFLTLLYDSKKLEKFPFLGLFILKHHSVLKKIEDSDLLKVKNAASERKEQIEKQMKRWKKELHKQTYKLDIASKVNFTDTYGLFKFADILSANNQTDYKISKPNKKIEQLKSWLIDKVHKKELSIREETLKIQINLSKTDNHLLLRAPTGWGKTAASLSYAIGKDSKIIYVLPTITSIKNFYDDLCSFFGKEDVGEFFYYADVEAIDSDFREIMFSSYFAKPVIVTTLDQLLLSFLQVGKYFMKRPHLRNSTIILDEVHTFSQNMLYIFSYFIEKFLSLYNLKLCVMSATFPIRLKEHFTDLLGKPEQIWLNDEFKNRKRVMYKLEERDILELIDDIVKLWKRKPMKLAIICNTVEKSQIIFEKLQEKNLSNIELLHSRFIYRHRSQKEDKISRWIKKGKNFILVATQVVEVSLDISFDFMITECAPLESLVQRFGRINRYGNITDKVNVWITFPHEILSNKGYPYEKDDIEKTFDFLKNFEKERLKNELQLIEEYDKIAYLSKIKQKEVYSLLDKWSENTSFLYSWQVDEDFAQKLFKFRDEITILVIPSVYEEEVLRLYDQMKKESSYFERKKLFAKIKEYTVSVPIWMAKTPKVEGFPIVPIYYDETYGVKKEIDMFL